MFDGRRALSKYHARPNAGRASELLTIAFVHDYRDGEIDAVAEAFVNDQRPLLRELAESALTDPDARARQAARVEHKDAQTRIRRLKAVLTREPRNALRWADLAREYTVLAQPAKAIDAMRVAVHLAPASRFVLRSAAALYVHVKDEGRALWLLESAPSLAVDPWVLAPYVAISDLAHSKLLHHRDAVRLLDDNNLSPRHVAELAAALGTAELNAGSGRRGRQLLRRSVDDPTENSLAQVEWMSARLRSRLVEGTTSHVPRDFEAQARRAAYEGRWSSAVSSSSLWLTDQPFSGEAACFGSFCAWMSEDWGEAHRLADEGLQSNPGDPVLLNNVAVALIEAGDIRRAIGVLTDGRGMQAQRRDRALLAATEGLLFFRIGMIEEGRGRYDRIITFFEDQHEDEIATRAALILAREEALANTTEAESSWKRADAMMSASPTADLRTLSERVGAMGRVADAPVVTPPRNVEQRVESLLALPAAL